MIGLVIVLFFFVSNFDIRVCGVRIENIPNFQVLEMHVKSAEFVTSAVKPDQYPEARLPEIAFAGRSNVGKSSLINTLVNRKHLVKTSSTPGRTRLINFFIVNQAFYLVDLPGYGYAKVPAAVKKKWGPMIEGYLKGRSSLQAVTLIMDIRRLPQVEERNFIDWLNLYHIPVIPVLTKADKLSKNKRNKQVRLITAALEVDRDQPTLFSAKSRLGKEQLWEIIETLVTRTPQEELQDGIR